MAVRPQNANRQRSQRRVQHCLFPTS